MRKSFEANVHIARFITLYTSSLSTATNHPVDRGLNKLLRLDDTEYLVELQPKNRDATRLEIHARGIARTDELVK